MKNISYLLQYTKIIVAVLLSAFVLIILRQPDTVPAKTTATNAPNLTLIPANAVWKYLDDGSNQGTVWSGLGFDDSSWASGPAELGYGDGDEVTTVSYGANIINKYITTYFRHTFTVTDISLYDNLYLNLVRDDGAVVYLNGTEILNSNMPAGTINSSTPALTTISAPGESSFSSTTISPAGLISGTNVMAVEIHQVNGFSSDISFNLELGGLKNYAFLPLILKPEVQTATTFAIIGDYGDAGQPELDVANLVKSWQPDFIITTGDNNYSTEAAIDSNIGQYYHEFIGGYNGSYGVGSANNRFYPTLGNHDWLPLPGIVPSIQYYLDYFTLPGNEEYYDFSSGTLEFFAIDSNTQQSAGRSASSTQATWLKNRLAASTATWKVVYMHHPPYSSSSAHGSEAVMQWPYQEWGATTVIAGHDHTYERIMVNGFPYFVNGLGGRNIYSLGSPVPGSAVLYNGDYGAMLVTAYKSSINFQFIARTGAIVDSYTINK